MRDSDSRKESKSIPCVCVCVKYGKALPPLQTALEPQMHTANTLTDTGHPLLFSLTHCPTQAFTINLNHKPSTLNAHTYTTPAHSR